ncbi:vitamin B12-dependent ribonucleotide reductase [Candidatus Woesearchaeota archaeon]|nr:MAG: vitamin B12-dependent ribonucleotide reductase [Candidatus Woesearchaeota archaeon]
MLEFDTQGLSIERRHTTPGVNPLDQVEYEKRDSVITNPDGSIVFEMRGIEVPKQFSQLATDIIASKYFRKAGVPETGSEISARQVVRRIAHTIRTFGEEKKYFKTAEDAQSFEDELSYLLITQRAAFNSPVWFNCGLFQEYGIKGSGGNYAWDFNKGEIVEIEGNYMRPQCSACFIQSVEDDLMAIFDLIKAEAKLFKYGSGTGTNFSKIRGKQEKLSGGGTSSGLMSFLEVFDRGAGATKSGGTTRRAAKMVCLDMDHPEIEDFITWKVKEEEKALALIAAGYESDFNGEAYKTVAGQNSNNSVRLPDSFMNAVLEGKKWRTTMRTTGEVVQEYDAKELWDKINYSAWRCADPGVQFDTTINKWHTCPNTDRINASNPCSEYMFLDNSACNLASVNLIHYLKENGELDIEAYRHANRIMFIAQEILVDLSSYPTKEIAKNSHEYRPLGLGYANLGTVLMCKGLAYDSEEGRAVAAAITAIMTGHAYLTSAEMAAVVGPFKGFEKNREPMLNVMRMHRDAAYKIDVRYCPKDLLDAAREDWDKAVAQGEKYGYRNAQATVIAPTGTIGLLMDCDTTGVEPEFAIVKYKKLAGGGYFRIINQSIPRALKTLGYSEEQIEDMIEYVLGRGTFDGAPVSREELHSLGFTEEQIKKAEEAIEKSKSFDDFTPEINPKSLRSKGISQERIKELQIYIGGAQTLEGAPHLKEEHLPVFDTANKCGIGKRFIAPMGHVKMMAAVQPFISGAISKTVNLPNDATVEDIAEIHLQGWKLGLKAIALYRDGCKASQPLNTSQDEAKEDKVDAKPQIIKQQFRRPLPKHRRGTTVEASVAGNKIYIRTGEYEDGSLGEIFIDMHKEGAAYRSLLNCLAISVSKGLQYGVPLKEYVDTFTFTRFEPNGMVDHPNIKTCTSVIDFAFRALGMLYLGQTDFVHVKPDSKTMSQSDKRDVEIIENKEENSNPALDAANAHASSMMGDAPACSKCGHITVRNGACYKCLNCGNSEGCS